MWGFQRVMVQDGGLKSWQQATGAAAELASRIANRNQRGLIRNGSSLLEL